MDYFILALIGIAMGSFGGLLGIGGSVVTIPALVLAFGENQHLYQASAMLCNFFVGGAATLVHILPKNWVRAVFVMLLLLASYRMFTVAPGL